MAGQRVTSLMEVDSAQFRDELLTALQNMAITSRTQLISIGATTRDRARQYCPVDTGWLKASIQMTKGEDSKGFFVEVGVMDTPMSGGILKRVEAKHTSGWAKGGKITIRTPKVYAWFVEFGTTKMPAQPFLRPALAEAAGMMSYPRSVRSIAGTHGRQRHHNPRTFTVTGEGG